MIQEKKKVLSEVAFFRCIMLFSVVLGHCSIVFTGNNWGGIQANHVPYLAELTYWLSTFHTYAFVFISGYLFSYGRYVQGKYRTVKTDVCKRAKRLLVPYAVISLFWAMPIDIFLVGNSVIETMKNYVFVLSVAQIWFLVMLFNVWCFFYFTSDIFLKLPIWLCIACLVGLRLLCVFMEKMGLPIGVFGISNTLRYALLFYLGMQVERRTIHFNNKWLLCLAFLLIEIAAYLGYRYYISLDEVNSYFKEILFIAANVSGVFLTWSIINGFSCERLTKRAWFICLSQCSMGVYLIHQQLLYVLMRMINITDFHPVLVVILNFGVVIAVSVMIVYLLRKTKMGRLVLGG